MGALIVEHEFELPKGYVDAEGNLQRKGIMRLATAADEILPMRDPRVASLPAYLIVILLSRVVVRLGTLTSINPGLIEGLFAEDLAFLRQLYNQQVDPIEVIILKDLYEMLERAIDRCRDAGNVVFQMVLKYS